MGPTGKKSRALSKCPLLQLPYPEQILINEYGQCLCSICLQIVSAATSDIQKHVKADSHSEAAIRKRGDERRTKPAWRNKMFSDIHRKRHDELWPRNKSARSSFQWPTLFSDDVELKLALHALTTGEQQFSEQSSRSCAACVYTSSAGTPTVLALYKQGLVWILQLTNISSETLCDVLLRLFPENVEDDLLVENVRDFLGILSKNSMLSEYVTSRLARSVKDIQLGYQVYFGNRVTSVLTIAKQFKIKTSPSFQIWYSDRTNQYQRGMVPLTEQEIHYIREHVVLVKNVSAALREYGVSHPKPFNIWIKASEIRSKTVDSFRCREETAISFHHKTFAKGTAEILQASGTAVSTALNFNTEEMNEEMELLLGALPEQWAEKIRSEIHRQLVDVEMDIERLPFAFFRNGPKMCLSNGDGDVVTEEHITNVEEMIDTPLNFMGDDNRRGIEGCLHRLSLIRMGLSGQVLGITLRVGRHVSGVATAILDLLLEEKNRRKSILLLGKPGTGKTTILRDIASILSKENRVIIIDSSNEIGGYGLRPHRAVGDARRMSVYGGKKYMVDTLVEAIENHTPQILVVDELSSAVEVKGVGTAKERGVRVISSAHGDLHSLLKNSALRGLLGGMENVTLGDQTVAKALREGIAARKVNPVRSGNPISDIIIELGTNENDISQYRIVDNVAEAVDLILQGKKHEYTIRRRAASGHIMLQTCEN